MRSKRNTGKMGRTSKKSGVFSEIPEKGEELQKKLVNTRKERSFQAAPGKQEELPESLVKRKKNPVFLLQHREKKKSFRKNW